MSIVINSFLILIAISFGIIIGQKLPHDTLNEIKADLLKVKNKIIKPKAIIISPYKIAQHNRLKQELNGNNEL